MREAPLRKVLARLGIQPSGRVRLNGWLEFHCPLAPYTHQSRTDSRASAAAKVDNKGMSLWTCATCHGAGRLTSLVNELQRHRGVFYEGLIREIDQADQDALANAPAPEYDPNFEHPVAEAKKGLVEEAYRDIYPAAGTADAARQYLSGRGIHKATAEKLSIRFDPNDKGVPRVLFPVRGRENELWGFTGRAIVPIAKGVPKVRDYFGLPKREVVLGAERWRRGKPLVLVEGLFAYAHLHEVGVEEIANIGCLLGSVMTPEKATMVRAFDEPVYLLLDNDDAGDIGLFGRHLPDGKRDLDTSAIHLLRAYVPVMVPEWPEGKDDPDQLTFDEVQGMIEWTEVYTDV